MAKKEKSIEERRKGFKRRGVIYCILIVLMIVATIVLSLVPVNKAMTKALYPHVKTITLEGEERQVYSELSVEDIDGEKVDVSAFYYLDENGEKVYVSAMYKLTPISYIKTGYEMDAKIRVRIIRGAAVFLMILFILLLMIYLLKLSYFLSNYDEEWSRELRDKRVGLSIFLDKLATKFSKMNKADKKKKG